MSAVPLFVELCAGTAAVSLMLHGGRHARPPVPRMGSKRKYAHAILECVGLRPGQGAERYLWCEPDDGCRAMLGAYTDRRILDAAVAIMRGWADEDPRELWYRLQAEGPVKGADGPEVARWIQRAVWSYVQGDVRTGFFGPDRGRWPVTTATATATALSRVPDIPAATVAPDARKVDPPRIPDGTIAYIDPPYVGTTGYADALPRTEVVALARRWADAGAWVVVSEATPVPALVADGWHAVEITDCRRGARRTFSKQQREWLTLSMAPAWRPSEQVALW